VQCLVLPGQGLRARPEDADCPAHQNGAVSRPLQSDPERMNRIVRVLDYGRDLFDKEETHSRMVLTGNAYLDRD
jgi:hypothetical protein